MRPSQPLGYYYCRFQEENAGEVNLMLRKWLVQLCDVSDIPKALRDLYDSCHEGYPATEPTSNELEQTIFDVLRAYDDNLSARHGYRPKVFLLVDALDEVLDVERAEVLLMLQRISRAGLRNIFLLAVSRDWPLIEEYLRPEFEDLEIDYRSVDDEIRSYVPRAISSTPTLHRQSQKTQDRITARLVEQANGM
jgi:hypothetical protein